MKIVKLINKHINLFKELVNLSSHSAMASNKCEFVITKGKNAGQLCNKKVCCNNDSPSIYCNLHSKSKSTNTKINNKCNENDITKIKQIYNKVKEKMPKNIKTKLKNINKAGSCALCSTKRVSQASRRICEYSHIVKCNHTIEQLNTHINGVVIEVPFREHQRIKRTDEATRSPLDQYILNNIGGNSNKNVVAVISMRKEHGYSGSSSHRVELETFKQEIELQDWKPIYELNMPNGVKNRNKNKGNLNWGGHYYYNVSGGSKTSFKSHTKEPQIFTTSKGFMSNSNIIIDVEASLYWQLLHCHDISKYISNENVFAYKKILEQYLKSKIYLGKSCFDHLEELENIWDGKLISPITRDFISIHAFDSEKMLNEDDQANISHNEAAGKNKSYFCSDQNVILSDYRPGNLFWDTHLGNMQQQSFTIQEYWSEMDKRNSIRTAQLQSKKANTLEHNSLDI